MRKKRKSRRKNTAFDIILRRKPNKSKYIVETEDGKRAYEFKLATPEGNLTPRMKMLADLSTLGLKQYQIHQYTKTKPNVRRGSASASVGLPQRDLRVLERTESKIDEMVSEARSIIQKASTKAAQNYADAVDLGDLKASGKVLDLCGAFVSQKDVNVNVSFGNWLKQSQDVRGEIDITPKKEALDESNPVRLLTPSAPSEEDNKSASPHWGNSTKRPEASVDGFGHLDSLVDSYLPESQRTQRPEDERILSGDCARIAMDFAD